MKTKLSWVIAILLVFLVFSMTASSAIPAQVNEKAKPTPPGLEKIEFIHYKKDFAKPEAAKAPKAPSCYKFLTPTKIKWKTLPVSYVINPTNSGLVESFVTGAVSTSAETWDASTSNELMKDAYTISYTATYNVLDGKNAITFGNYPTAGVIAVTTVWYNPVTKAIVEFDVMFDTDYNWYDCTQTSCTSENKGMDLQNIATHELGHGVGLADIYDTSCSAVTMYGYSDYGDIIKRDLALPDITGLRTLYEV